MNMHVLFKIAVVVLIIGGLNVGLDGAFHFNAIGTVAGAGMLYRVIEIIIGVAALVKLYAFFGAKK